LLSDKVGHLVNPPPTLFIAVLRKSQIFYHCSDERETPDMPESNN
jgi:hypothetical protein